jgi:senataxin
MSHKQGQYVVPCKPMALLLFKGLFITQSVKLSELTVQRSPPGTGKTSTICGLVTAALKNRATPIVAGRKPGTEGCIPPKVLICAPSNAAIDEVAKRIKEGYRGSQKGAGPAPVVRVGADSAINASVKDISLDSLVDEKIGPSSSNNDVGNEISLVRQELESIKEKRREKLQELTNVHDNVARTQALEDEIKRINSHRMNLSHKFDQLKDKQKSDLRSMDAARRKARLEVVQEADIICSTLSGSGHELLEQFEFEMVVIDEAAQAIELSTLIPMKYRWKRCVMVGDPQQLPPTVLSMEVC